MAGAVITFSIIFVTWLLFKGYRRLTQKNLKVAADPAVGSAAKAPKDVKYTLSIEYCDSKGDVTRRDIAPYKKGATNRRFEAWCSLRQERRTFVFEQIRGGVDLATGELLTRREIYQRIHPDRAVPENIK